MGTYIDIQGDPNDLTGRGAMLKAIAEKFQAAAGGVASQIADVEGEQPWGHDKFGDAFVKFYTQPPEGGGDPVKDQIKQGLSEAGDLLGKVGGKTILAMTEYQGTDAENAADITATQP
jgi:hypothetical protein